MDEEIEKKVKELYEKAKKHRDLANEYREKLDAFLEKPLAEPQEGLETLGDAVREVKRLEKVREITLEEIYENEQALSRYDREQAEEEAKKNNVKIYDLPHTPASIIKCLLDKSMTFSDLVKYFRRICHGFSNKSK